VKPVPETEAALEEFLETDESDLDRTLREMAAVVRTIVPECIGLSLTLVAEDLTFTLVASDPEMATIDAAQYVDGGPCLRDHADPMARHVSIDEALDEERWALFARASAAHGVASSLSLAVMKHDEVVGGVNLYASTPDAFIGHDEALATALGASAGSAVTDADLGFFTRRLAEQAPSRLRERRDVEVAVGLLAARYDESVDQAQERLATAAARAGVAQPLVARVLVAIHQS
jgi:GAF domain-containing protein